MTPIRTPAPIWPVLCHVASARGNASVLLLSGVLGTTRYSATTSGFDASARIVAASPVTIVAETRLLRVAMRCGAGVALRAVAWSGTCLLYTSDAADDLLCVDLG